MTYSEILYYLKDLAENTPLVHTVTKGDISSIDLEKANIYPLLHISIDSGGFTNGQTVTWEITLEALQQRDFNKEPIKDKFWGQDNEVDNHNEMHLVINTIWTQIFRDWQDKFISSNANPSFNKITFAKGNVLDGWGLSFTIEVPNDLDLCL